MEELYKNAHRFCTGNRELLKNLDSVAAFIAGCSLIMKGLSHGFRMLQVIRQSALTAALILFYLKAITTLYQKNF